MSDASPNDPFLDRQDVRDQEQRSRQMGDEIRRYLLAVNTLAVGGIFALLGDLTSKPEKFLALLALLLFGISLAVGADSWFRAKEKAMQRREAAKEGRGRYPWWGVSQPNTEEQPYAIPKGTNWRRDKRTYRFFVAGLVALGFLAFCMVVETPCIDAVDYVWDVFLRVAARVGPAP